MKYRGERMFTTEERIEELELKIETLEEKLREIKELSQNLFGIISKCMEIYVDEEVQEIKDILETIE